ncbi:MAG: NAD(P)/FAD-dependent oxidoreductase [Planctomycetaceae bacterium]|nr:NAD(P)/FAD-dependent oxidoreductase [Planctomycetaceae bacterium]
MTDHWDAIVIGAGAAGLLASARLAERGQRTLLVEKNRKPGVKILISGGTRCNLTHHCDARGIIAAFGSAGNFLHSPLAALGPRELVELFHAEGVPTKIEAYGKIFPSSDRALDVVNALVRRLHRCGAELALGEAVQGIEPTGDGFRVVTELRTLNAAKVLVTTGGKSYPGCGTTGDGYRWLAQLGHTIRPPRPALVPLTTDQEWVKSLAGITIPDAMVRVVDPRLLGTPAKGKRRALPPGVLIERRGAVLFAHFGLTGPAILDVSRAITSSPNPRDLRLLIDFVPDTTPGELDERLRQATVSDGKKLVIGVLPEVVPRRLLEYLFTHAEVPHDRRLSELSKLERARLIEQFKGAPVIANGSRGFEKAEVTAGGVSLDEVDSRTMQSKLVPNLYLAGEILDFDGYIGGYNFQAAFSTGWLAAESM